MGSIPYRMYDVYKRKAWGVFGLVDAKIHPKLFLSPILTYSGVVLAGIDHRRCARGTADNLPT
jgi:hypothetical protein